MNLQMEKNCPTSITTNSGTFTFYEQRVEKCEAEHICKSKGQILAPITNLQDRVAIGKLSSQKCGIFIDRYVSAYHIGLEIKKCGNKVTKVFSNGVTYNKTLHDKFYHFYPAKGYDHCLTALYVPNGEVKAPISVIGKYNKCKDYHERFICFNPAKPDNISTVTEEAHHLKRSKRSVKFSRNNDLLDQQNFYFVSQIFGVCFLATVCCFLLVTIRKLKKRNNFLEMKTKLDTNEC